MAEWIAEGEPSLDLWEMDVRRFGAQYRSPAYTHARTRETYETYYDIRYPNHERSAGRPLRVSAANAWHAEHDAAFGEKSGWERVNWYESNAGGGDEGLRPRGWAGQHWSPAIGAEHRGDARGRGDLRRELVREAGDLGAGRRGAARAPLRQPGRARRREDHLHADAQHARRDRVRLHRRPPRRGAVLRSSPAPRSATTTASGSASTRRTTDRVAVRDVTSRLVMLRDLGPAGARRARAADAGGALQRRLPLHVGARDHRRRVPVRALRVTYVGELGWEIYCPTEYGLGLWRTLWAAGEQHGIVAGGYRAIDSLRLEKGYRVWGADITPDETPYEGGLGFCVKLDKEGGFIGRDALAEANARQPAHGTVLPGARRPALRRARQRARPRRAARSPGA